MNKQSNELHVISAAASWQNAARELLRMCKTCVVNRSGKVAGLADGLKR